MRVCLDCTPLLIRSAGVKTYLHHLAAELVRQQGSAAVTLFPGLSRPEALNHQRSPLSLPSTAARLAYVYATNIRQSRLLDWMGPGADVFHCSNQVRNPPRRMRLTATVHDASSWIVPEMHLPSTVELDRIFVTKVLQRAGGLISVSEHSKADAIRYMGLAPERIHVIHHGVADPFFEISQGDIEAIRLRYSLTKRYILFVSTIEPRKNVDRLLDAYAGLSASTREDVELVVSGPGGWQSAATMSRLRSGMAGVRYLGYVPERDLPGLTAGAAVFAYPSWYEGFGLPVAQAMACGVPVVTTDRGALPEVAGEAALFVDPGSTVEISNGLERILSTPSLAAQLSRIARTTAQQYHWSTTAKQTWQFFEMVAGR